MGQLYATLSKVSDPCGCDFENVTRFSSGLTPCCRVAKSRNRLFLVHSCRFVFKPPAKCHIDIAALNKVNQQV